MPHFIHELRGMCIVFAGLSHAHTQRGPPLHAVLPSSAYPLSGTPLPHESALATEHAGADLGAGGVS